jgi:hypothetical protein
METVDKSTTVGSKRTTRGSILVGQTTLNIGTPTISTSVRMLPTGHHHLRDPKMADQKQPSVTVTAKRLKTHPAEDGHWWRCNLYFNGELKDSKAVGVSRTLRESSKEPEELIVLRRWLEERSRD